MTKKTTGNLSAVFAKPIIKVAKTALLLLLAPALFLTGAGCTAGNNPAQNGETTQKPQQAETTPAPVEETPAPTLPPAESMVVTSDDNYVNTAAFTNRASRAVDDLGRTLLTETETETTPAREGKYVGLFYFLWLGEHGTNLYDNTEIAKVEGALDSEEGWLKAGGGPVNAFHFWGKPLFGYYKSTDKWVMRKHVQMLTDAGVDFLVFDVSNAQTYSGNALELMKILKEYQDQGWNVPKVCFLTNTNSGATMKSIYKTVYKKHPEYESVWFYWDGKPLIIGIPGEANDELRDFFRIKYAQWPMGEKVDDGFPWMEFDRLLTDDAVYGLNGRKEVVNVSLAQHNETYKMSAVSWYGSNDRSRSWHNGANDPAEDAYKYGYNFAEQFEWALKVDPEIIFITGWNEWVAQRQPASYQGPVHNDGPIVFLDNASLNGSRDIEPMEGGYGDNYYLQMISYIRRFKGLSVDNARNNRPIDVAGGFAQWNDIKAYYRDYLEDTPDRKTSGWGKEKYRDSSGRNDFVEMKVCEDGNNVYFFAKTAADITAAEGGNWMNLFIGIDGSPASSSWNGYQFVVNYKAPEKDGVFFLGKLEAGSEYSVSPLAEISGRISGNMIMLEVPKSALGIEAGSPASIVFKWADNCTEGDVMAFYTTGDAAPIGRAGYYYGP
ncbi:MAG: hypothetical protein J6X47_10210 [Clostridia bacterium]|nr:hypothetical protein [Clostridia bacterium]